MNIESIDVDMLIAAKEKNDSLLLEVVKYQQKKLKEYEELLNYKQNLNGVSPAGLISPKAAAKYLGLSEWTVRESAKQGYFHEIPFLGKIFYSIKEIDAYIQGCMSSKLKNIG